MASLIQSLVYVMWARARACHVGNSELKSLVAKKKFQELPHWEPVAKMF